MSLTSAARTSLWPLELVVVPLELLLSLPPPPQLAAPSATTSARAAMSGQLHLLRTTGSSLPSVLVWESDGKRDAEEPTSG